MESWMAEHTDCHFKIKALEAELESVKAKLERALQLIESEIENKHGSDCAYCCLEEPENFCDWRKKAIAEIQGRKKVPDSTIELNDIVNGADILKAEILAETQRRWDAYIAWAEKVTGLCNKEKK